jgi:4-hydroxy-tetrahydrodipicolinate synthase
MLSFKGVIPPLLTPLQARDRLDLDGLTQLIENVLAGGVHGVFLLGTTGEGPSLSHRLQRQFVEEAVRCIEGRVPVLVGITDTSVEESLTLARLCADEGVDAVVLAAPYYFPMHQADLVRYVQDLLDELPLPLVLYNMPSHSKVAFEIETVRRLAEDSRIIGVKDSSAQLLYFHKLLEIARDRPDFSVLMGPEELLGESVLMGGHGGVCGGANLVPELYVDLYEAALTGELREVLRLQQQVLRLSKLLYEVAPAPTGYLTGVKTAANLLGLCSDRLAEPLYQMSPEKRRQLAQHLRDLGLQPTGV